MHIFLADAVEQICQDSPSIIEDHRNLNDSKCMNITKKKKVWGENRSLRRPQGLGFYECDPNPDGK